MRHRRDHRKLSRTSSHRRALLRNLVTSLFRHERIQTTVAKAKEARRLAERLITSARRDDVASRRHVARFVTQADVSRKLFDTIAPWYSERPSGYTRILRIGRRLGDAGETVYLELVKTEEQKEKARQERIAVAEAKEKALKGGEKAGAARKAKSASEAPAAEGEKPKRGRRRQEGGGTESTPSRKRTRKGVKTG
jgi:large subunit ribosomal protein L17